MSYIERLMLHVHERLRATGEAPRFMGEAGVSPLPPPLRSGKKQVRRQVGRKTYELEE